MTIDLKTRVRRAPTAAWREIDGQVAIVSTDVNRVRLLNDVGGFLWRLCDGLCVADLIDAVRGTYAVDHTTAMDDIHCFINDLATRGMVSLEGSS